VSMRQRIKVKY